MIRLLGMMVTCRGLLGTIVKFSEVTGYQYDRFRDDNAIGATANAMETANAIGVLIVGLLCLVLAHLIQLDHAMRQWWDWREEDRTRSEEQG